MDKIDIQRVNSSHVNGLVDLYNEVWPEVSYDKRSKTIFVIEESPGVSYCAVSNDEIVGSRLSYSINLYNGRNPLKCIQVCDTCTKESFRGKGIMGSLNEALLKQFFQEENGQIIFNVGVAASRRVNEHYGWQYINSLTTLLKICRPLHVFLKIGFDIRKLLGVVEWDTKDDIQQFDDSLLETRENIMRDLGVLHVNYNKHSLISRLTTHSGIKVFISNELGMLLYKLGNKNGLTFALIGECFPKSYTASCMKKLISEFNAHAHPDLIKTAVSIGHPLHAMYRKNGFIYNFKNKFLNHGVRVENDRLKSIVYNPDNWAISMLDIDTF